MSSREADEIRRRMAELRGMLRRDAQATADELRQLTDWRYYVKSYPWACAAVAAAIGYLLVPRRVEVVQPTSETLAELARRHRLVVTPDASPQPKGGLLVAALTAVGGLVARTAFDYLGQQARKMFVQRAAGTQPATDGKR